MLDGTAPGALTWRDRFLLAEATFWLLISRMSVLILPFRWVMRTCGAPQALSPASIPPESRNTVEHITWAVEAVRWATPWDSNCLARAIAGKRMLRRRGLASTLYLGVSKKGSQKLIAHAWLRCGEHYVAGAPEHEGYTVVATFAEQ